MNNLKYFLILLPIILLTSCQAMTQQDRLLKIKQCEELWVSYWISTAGNVHCKGNKQDKVMECIREYTNWIDEKYNNPDTVSNLREDRYSQVVKTCNEIFGKNKNLN